MAKKKLTMTESLPLPVELNLDSFLHSYLSADEDDDGLLSVPHRTVDEILNDSDSSSSPSSPPSSSRQRAVEGVSLSSAKSITDSLHDETQKAIDALKPVQLEEKSVQSMPGLFSRDKSGEFFDDAFRRVSRPLPSLFGGVRSNTKPGAALAAAAAASRSMPTPHAAAIKSRRAVSGSFQKIVDGAELSSAAGDDSEAVSDGLSSSNGEKFMDEGEKMGDFQTAVNNFTSKFSARDEALSTNEIGTEHVPGTVEFRASNNAGEELMSSSSLKSTSEPAFDSSSMVNFEDDANFDGDFSTPNLGEVKDEIADVVEKNSSFPGAADDEKAGPSVSESDLAENIIDNSTSVMESESKELERGISGSKEEEVGLVGDDASSISDINELVEETIEQLESKRINERAEKKSRPVLKPLELAEELEKKQASTGLDWEEGAAAQPMRLEGVRRGSTTLGYFDVDVNNTVTRTISSQVFKRDHGSPQVLAVHTNYIAVGMAKGVIVVVPSKYSAHNFDNMDSKVVMLGVQGDRSHAGVTSICFNQQGDLLLAGYSDGHMTVWDVQRAYAVKVITGEHTAPVVHTLFLGQDSQGTRNFKAVTGDSKGLVLLHAFSVVPLLNRFTIKTQCLLDGEKTGIVLSASPLLFDESFGGTLASSEGYTIASASSIGGMMGGVVGADTGWKLFNEGSTLVEEGVVIFVTHQTALVVRLSPNLEVYAQLSKPDGVREGSMPYTAWKCTTQSQSSTAESVPVKAVERVSLLAIAWDRKVQVAKLVKSELKVYGKWSLDSAAIGLAWLDDQMLVILTVSGQLCLFAKDGTVIHQTSFAVDVSGREDLVAYHTHFINVFGNPEKAYHNCVGVRGASIYVLGPMHLVVCRLLPWKERIQVLRKAGDWMGSMNMAMTIYDGQAHGVVDLPRSLEGIQEAIMPYLVELLLSYVDEVFSYISVAFCNQVEKVKESDDPNGRNSSVHSEIKEQYTRVGGVAVEFCVHIKRTDILFDEIFSKFVAVQQRDTFLELLEPYILKDMLGSLPPEIMQALVEHYSSKGWLQRVEQCVLHMDISSLDFNQVVRLCREHALYGALVYLFNKGLNDFRTPLEELLVVLRNSKRESVSALGYRMLVYLKYCFSGLAFPPGQGTVASSRLPSLRTELLQFLLEGSDDSKSRSDFSLSFKGAYLNLYNLLELDTEATLEVLACAFLENEIQKPESTSEDSDNGSPKANIENNSMTRSQKLLLQNMVDALVHILDKDISLADRYSSSDSTGPGEEWPAKKDIGHLFEFIANYVASGRAIVSKTVLSRILEYLTSESHFPSKATLQNANSKRREKQVLALLEVMPESHWNASNVLDLCEKAHFHQVCGLIHTIRQQYIAALDSYMKDVDEPIHAFLFINKTLTDISDKDRAAFRSAVISRIPELVNLSREGTFILVNDYFNSEASEIFSELCSHQRSLFLYLKTIIEVHLSGTVNFSNLKKDNIVVVKDLSRVLADYSQKIADFPKFLRSNPVNVTDDMVELYLELLCQYEQASVLKFLETFDSYRVEHCLRLCQQYKIVDAAAFLLERVGDVGNALLLTLSSLNDKFNDLDTAIKNIFSNSASKGSTESQSFSSILRLIEVKDIENILHACIVLCQRNTPRLNPEESETLWFRLLDSVCDPLMDIHVNERVSQQRSDGEGRLLAPKDEEECIIKWRISKSQKNARTLRKLFSQFIKEIVEGMIGYVRLPTIMSKLLSDNGSQEFGDFKFTILGMLGTYGFERRILDAAKSLIEDDTFYTMSLLKRGATHAYAPRDLTCCICNCPLTKNSSSSRIRVFNCGHATHIQCEVPENGSSSNGGSFGCPLCMPTNTSQSSRRKSVIPQNGLVKKFPSRAHSAQGTSGPPHQHENDPSEHHYALQQIARFEILSNLQKEQRVVQIENMPQLRLAPPAVYHEKVKKGTDSLVGGSSNALEKIEKQIRSGKLRDLKVKGSSSSSLRFPLKSSLFRKEINGKR